MAKAPTPLNASEIKSVASLLRSALDEIEGAIFIAEAGGAKVNIFRLIVLRRHLRFEIEDLNRELDEAMKRESRGDLC